MDVFLICCLKKEIKVLIISDCECFLFFPSDSTVNNSLECKCYFFCSRNRYMSVSQNDSVIISCVANVSVDF